MKLQGKVAIVTGAAGCLGQVIAATLAQHGCHIAAWDLNATGLETTQQQHPDWLTSVCDLTAEDQVAEAVEQTIARFGQIDILINNAGLIRNRLLFNLTGGAERRHPLADWHNVINANLTSAFVAGSHVAEHMVLKRIRGAIVNISSIAAQGNAGQSAYSAAKAGVEALTMAWAKELGPLGIRVAAVAPGFADTESTRQALSETALNDWIKKTALRRLVQPQNIADAIVAILTNDDLTGLVVPVDGGLRI